MGCLGDNTIGAFVEGRLPASDAAAVREHLAGCEECRALVRAVVGNTARASTLTGATLAGTYRVKHLLGSGAMGTVYAGEHLRLTRPVAIKVMGEALRHHPEALERFRREAQVCSRLGNPHIVDVLDFDTLDDGTPFMVMELLEGEDLAQRLVIDGAMAPAMVISIMRQICSALGRAHDEGVLHRDLKPSNIFLGRGDADLDPFVKVLDFGISKVRGALATLTGSQEILGTPYYMSPEMAQARHAEVDQRSDLFSLGAIAYEALVCRRAFDADSIPGALYRIVHEEPEPLAQASPEVPRGLAELVGRLLAKDRDARPESARAVVEALARLEPAPSLAPPRPADPFAPTIAQLPETLKTQSSAGWKRLALPGLLAALVLAGLAVFLWPGSVRREAAPLPAARLPQPAATPDAGAPPDLLPPDAVGAPDRGGPRSKGRPLRRLHRPHPKATQPKGKQPRTKVDNDPIL